MKKYIFFLVPILLCFSCKKNIQQQKKHSKKTTLSIVEDFPKPDALNTYSKNNITNWEEHEALTLFLDRFNKISPNEAINNALELNNLVLSLKDSVKPKMLSNKAFNARVNVLENETLRLVDMSYIPSISANEVSTQILKIIEVFSSLNQKINTLYSQKMFEDAVKIKDPLFISDTTSHLKNINERKPAKKPKSNKKINKVVLDDKTVNKKYKRTPLKKDNK